MKKMIKVLSTIFALVSLSSVSVNSYCENSNLAFNFSFDELTLNRAELEEEHAKSGTCTLPVMTSFTASMDTLCGFSGVTLTLNGTLNDATAWHLYSGSCGGTLVTTNTSGVFGVTPSSTTSYFVRGEGSCFTPGACLSVTITVYPIHNTNENDSVCSGGSYTFPDNFVINDIQNQVNHTSLFTSRWGCDSSVTTVVDVIEIDTLVDVSMNVLTARDSQLTYQWLDCENDFSAISGETGRTYSAPSNGSFAVALGKSGCADTSACYQISGIGITDLDPGGLYSVYPNPFTDVMKIDFPESLMGTIEVLDITGEIVRSVKIPDTNSLNLDMADQPSGVYFVRINSTESVYTSKVLKQ